MKLESLEGRREGREEKTEVGERRERVVLAGSQKRPGFPQQPPESATLGPFSPDQEWQSAKGFIAIMESMG